jgi:hypothetical protein
MNRLLSCLLLSLSLGPLLPHALHANDDANPSTSRLDLYLSEGSDWDYNNGKEFKGAQGSLTVIKDTPGPDGYGFRLDGDFTQGGRYVGMGKNLSLLGVSDITAFRFKVKTATATEIGIRLKDSSGQIHQTKHLKLTADGEWHDYSFPISKLTGGEHWGGANDGKWHGPGQEFFLALKDEADSAGKHPVIEIADIRADTISGDQPAVTLLTEDFEKGSPAGWQILGDTRVTDQNAFSGKAALSLARTPEKFDVETAAISAPFPVRADRLEVNFACKADLHSPDNSFNAAVLLQCVDGEGKVVNTVRVADFSGLSNWTPVTRQVEVPDGTGSVRFAVQLNKASGSFLIDDIAVSTVASRQLKKSPIKRLIITSDRTGNLFYPDDKPVLQLTVESFAPLPPQARSARVVVTDYWGAEQALPLTFPLSAKPRAKGVFIYDAELDLSPIAFVTGKYYDLDVTMDLGDGDTPSGHSSLAVLPEAETKKHPWRDIPFSTRNWDNRLPEYFKLSDRLGIRLAGVWGTWNAEPPYKPAAPQYELCEKLDLGVLARTPIVDIEHHRKGYEKYTEQSLRKGVHEFFAKYDKNERLVMVLGNEPATSGESVDVNVANYKLMYEEIKKISPDTFVVGTSVGPVEEYFKRGFHQYCDAVDFHTYSDSAGIKSTFEAYQKLFAQYGHPKPIWSTEIGLNSQGLPRRTVAGDLIKKFSWFFSCGGANASWFGICYPDREGKLRGASDDSHNIFNGLWGVYSPRLDALAYYNIVNAICVKKFVEHRTYAGGVEAFLFRDADGNLLQVLWGDRESHEVQIPLAGIDRVEAVRIDGVHETLSAAGHGVTLRIGEDPVLLRYTGAQTSLPESLGEPAAAIRAVPALITRGQSAVVSVEVNDSAIAGLKLTLPPGWKQTAAKPVSKGSGRSLVDFTVTSPDETNARFAPLSFTVTDPARGDASLSIFLPVQGQIAASLSPTPAKDGTPPGIDLTITNNNPVTETLDWQVSLGHEVPVIDGAYSLEAKRAATAYFARSPQGSTQVEAGKTQVIHVPMSNVDLLHSYQVKADLTDKQRRTTSTERYVAGFVGVPKGSPRIDGNLDDEAWAKATPRLINEARQFRHFKPTSNWSGPADLSAELRFLWDDHYLYLGVKVTDDVFHNEFPDNLLWSGDSLQLIVDPSRAAAEKPGKYDYGFALTPKGPQAWCFLSADTRAPAGEAKDIVVTATKATDGTGGMTYEVAIPWIRLAPFQPGVGANLGLALALNEDDDVKRDGLMAWFGDIQTKEVTPVGDLILEK